MYPNTFSNKMKSIYKYNDNIHMLWYIHSLEFQNAFLLFHMWSHFTYALKQRLLCGCLKICMFCSFGNMSSCLWSFARFKAAKHSVRICELNWEEVSVLSVYDSNICLISIHFIITMEFELYWLLCSKW